MGPRAFVFTRRHVDLLVLEEGRSSLTFETHGPCSFQQTQLEAHAIWCQEILGLPPVLLVPPDSIFALCCVGRFGIIPAELFKISRTSDFGKLLDTKLKKSIVLFRRLLSFLRLLDKYNSKLVSRYNDIATLRLHPLYELVSWGLHLCCSAWYASHCPYSTGSGGALWWPVV